MNDKELNEMVLPLFDHGGPIKAISDAAWRRRTSALGDACSDAMDAIIVLIQRTEETQSDEIKRLRAELQAMIEAHDLACSLAASAMEAASGETSQERDK